MITGLLVGIAATVLLLASAWNDRNRNTARKEKRP